MLQHWVPQHVAVPTHTVLGSHIGVPHLPWSQYGAGPPHALPQSPQLSMSFCLLTHVPAPPSPGQQSKPWQSPHVTPVDVELPVPGPVEAVLVVVIDAPEDAFDDVVEPLPPPPVTCVTSPPQPDDAASTTQPSASAPIPTRSSIPPGYVSARPSARVEQGARFVVRGA